MASSLVPKKHLDGLIARVHLPKVMLIVRQTTRQTLRAAIAAAGERLFGGHHAGQQYQAQERGG
jgi:hypothetical protein